MKDWLSVIIPYGAKYIESGTFNGCSLTSVTIPNSIYSIRSYAFSSSGLISKLISVNVPKDFMVLVFVKNQLNI